MMAAFEFDDEPQDQQVAEMLWNDLKRQAQEIAKMRGPAPGVKKLTPEEETTLFWKMADGWTPDKEIALLAEGKSREEIGDMKYPERPKLAKSNGRALSKYQQAKWYADMAKKSDPAWAPPPNNYQEPAFPPDAPPDITNNPQFEGDEITNNLPTAPPTEAGLSLGG